MSVTYKDLMRQAYSWASHSPDPSSQNGAVLRTKNGSIVPGYNSIITPIEALHPAIWDDRPLKYKHVTHAEEFAILNAARSGLSTEGGTLVCPWAACTRCARQIIESGIVRVVRHKQRMGNQSDWDADILEADRFFAMASVEVITLDLKLDCYPIRVSGKLWSPLADAFLA